MDIIQAIILGIIQGLCEFLPISSSGHLEIVEHFLGVESDNFLFSILVHGATALSVIVVFWQRVRYIIATAFHLPLHKNTFFLLSLSSVPVGIFWLFLAPTITQYFKGNLFLVGVGLLITATLLFLVGMVKRGEKLLGMHTVLLMGFVQVLTVWPGISRSGTMITTALYMGVERRAAVEFSFLMVLFPTLGASFLNIPSLFSSHDVPYGDLSPTAMLAGVLSAFVTGIVSCHLMRRVVQRGRLWYFSLYCFVLGSVVMGWSLWH